MQMVLCIFKKKVSHALSGSVSQTICGKFGNSNCNFTSFTVPHHLLQQLLLCVIDAYCLRLLTLKKFYFQFYRQNWSRTEWIALQKNQSSGDFGPASKQTNIFFGGRIYLGTTPVMHRKTRITPPPKNIYDTFGNILF